MLSDELLRHSISDFSIAHDYIIHPINMKLFHHHNHFEILYLQQGSRIFSTMNSQYILTSNTIALVPPGLEHRTESPKDSFNERFLINFRLPFIEKLDQVLDIELLNCFDANNPIKEIPAKQLNDIQFLISKIFQEHNNLNVNYHHNMAEIQLVLSQLLLLCSTLSPMPYQNSENVNTINEIVNYIDLHFDEDITLDFLADKFKTNKYAISKKFPVYTLMSFNKYLTKVRMDNALSLLKQTKLSITDIALKTGYNNISHFSRVFKNTFGISPNCYRNAP